MEYSMGISISDQVWYDNRVQRLMDLCNQCAIFVNDVYSFEKEYIEANHDMNKMLANIVGFHVLKYECSVEDAIKKSLVTIEEYECKFKKLADSLVNDQGSSAECKTFIDGLTAVIAGNFAYSTQCKRYNDIYETK